MATENSRTVLVPSLDDLQKINQCYNLKCTLDDLSIYQEVMKGPVEDYNFVENFLLPSVEILGDRTYLYPLTEDNEYLAWYVKCNINAKKDGKLAGKKIAIKDNTAVANIPMMNGSKVLEGYIPEYDAVIVQRILNEGGIIIGKTTCEDLCFSGASYMTTYGPVRNPNNTEYSAGGSSSGSGVVVATGEADMATGGDQGGSIRIPASCCGIVGLKPTHGLIPYTGAIPIVPVIDHVGPMTKNVADCAIFLEVLAGYDTGIDYRQSPFAPVYEYSKLIYPLVVPKKKINVAILEEGLDLCDKDVKETFNQAVSWLKKSEFLNIKTVSLPLHKEAYRLMVPLFFDGVFGSMIDGCGYGTGFAGVQSESLVKKMKEGYSQHLSQISHNVKSVILLSNYIKEKFGPYYYAKASSLIAHMQQLYNNILQENDVIIMPTLTNLPCKLPLKDTPIKERMIKSEDMTKNTAIFDGTGHPALSLNCGFVGDLPVGLMVVGKHFDEVSVLNAAAIFEAIFMQNLKN
ncbi:amidase-like isoform X1 [Hydra vulgaris]|uniref:Amidase-like isoform X1 n=1 Tax=Hydra vulgaris TaxID=6087 RepID=A0ABM4DNL9_HYDVU